MNARRWILAAGVVAVAGCGTRRFYPPLSMQVEGRNLRLELGAVAVLPSGRIAAMDENDGQHVYEVRPDRVRPASHGGLGVDTDPLDLFRLTDPSQGCETPTCRDRAYRGHVTLDPTPINWQFRDGRVVVPHHVEDLSPYTCPAAKKCGERLLGVTEYSTAGRVTGFRSDKVSKAREQAERIFLLERGQSDWFEVADPAVERLRQALSDWGRATCGDDLVVEGIAFDEANREVYVGLNRCLGPSLKILKYPLGRAEAGRAASLTVYAEGADHAGPSEGISSLDFAYGHVWATSSWNDWGYEEEPVYGARLLAAYDGHLVPIPLGGALRDRADALAILPNGAMPDDIRQAADPRAQVPWLEALLLFDNDYRSHDRRYPNATIVHGGTPAPADGGWIRLQDLTASALGSEPLGLNGFDFRWYVRDHRVGLLSAVLDREADGPGAWTEALGGIWQVRLGDVGRFWRTAGLGKGVGHDRQAVDLTDFGPAKELRFTGYRAVLSVVPRERGDDPSVGRQLEAVRPEYEVEVPLPRVPAADAGLVLQGLTIDTSPRATGGICLSAADVDAAWARPGVVRLRAAILGGVCNDFEHRDAEEYHGLTTDPAAGVRVTLYFAVVEGSPAHRADVTVAELDRPGRRAEPGRIGAATPYATPDAPDVVGNHVSKDHLACFRVGDAVTVPPLEPRRVGPLVEQSAWAVRTSGEIPGSLQSGGGALSGFAFAWDLRGFDDRRADAWSDITAWKARNQSSYVYRYLVRAWDDPTGGLFVEGGITHGIHRAGFGRDAAAPTALLLRTGYTWWDGLSAAPERRVAADSSRPGRDPNLQPEDGWPRFAVTEPLPPGEVRCTPR